jgi:hypothetical protein
LPSVPGSAVVAQLIVTQPKPNKAEIRKCSPTNPHAGPAKAAESLHILKKKS